MHIEQGYELNKLDVIIDGGNDLWVAFNATTKYQNNSSFQLIQKGINLLEWFPEIIPKMDWAKCELVKGRVQHI